MGNESSTLAEEEEPFHDINDKHDIVDNEYYGFRVLGIQEQSPASAVGFVSFFDFIVEANGIRLDTRDATFMELIAQSEDRPMQLRVFNIKAQTTRDLQLTPSRKWSGKGLLGVTIRFDSYEGAEDQLLHVLHVAKSSPAERAGLQADSDYLLGTPERVFSDVEKLHDEIVDALDGSFQCFVYNSLNDQVRIVSIVPIERCGGGSVLGAEVGHGYLHRLPSACRNTVGSSVGFVNLPHNIKAATDAFLKPHGRGRDSQATSESQENEEEAVKVDTILDDSSAQYPTRNANEQQSDTEQNNHEGADNVSEATTGKVETSSPATTRYATCVNAQFPISTVAVLAEP